MKHHIAVKFTAILLATVSLFLLIVSAGSIIGLTAADLYEQSVDNLYEENMQQTRQTLAMHLVHQYASLEIGKIPESTYYEDWGSSWMYDNFRYGSYFYTIYNDRGKAVYSTAQDLPENVTTHEHVVTDLTYRHLVRIISPLDATEATIPPANTESYDVTEPAALIPQDQLHQSSYYDQELDQWLDYIYFYDELPPYTVELHLLPDAVTVEPFWDVLSVIWQYRYELFWVLGISVLIFAIAIVYLCCAAGKRNGQTEIHPAGLNCIPLDLYAAAGGSGAVMILALGYEIVEYLLRHSSDVLVPFVIFAGLGFCLLIVGFCFACAAQFKTPGGYWWRNSLIGRCLRLTALLCRKLFSLCCRAVPKFESFMRRAFRFLGKILKWTWAKGMQLILWLYRFTENALIRLFRLLGRFFRWLGKKMNRFLSMLPLTWQWLLTGFFMLMLMAVVIAANGEEVLVMVCFAACMGIILYGAHSFGILMESAKKMSKGDLESKVSDQFLAGSFREFAGDLNALADVAVIAAQKQLKSERMKTELITNVSHDIKTPLTSIINYVDLLEKPHTPEEGEEYLEVLHRQSQRLKKLVEDLMEMSKASSGNLNVDIVSLNAAEAVNQALGEFADKLERANLTPLFRQPEEPIYMKADGRLVWRVMSNLLSNAVKYALPGTRVYIDLAELEGKVIISMKNISREELNIEADELLERFVRGDVSRNTEGSGLGLNIAQSLMELQKGQLQLLVDGDLFKVTLTFPAVRI